MTPLIKERFKSIDKALELQAREYERRLEALNGEAERLRQMQANYIPREVFDRTIGDMKANIEILVSAKLKAEGKAQWIVVVPWILTLISLIIMYLNYSK